MSAIVRCIELGAEDYLPKSFDPPLLRARLAQLPLVPCDFAAIAGHRVALHAAMVPARQVGGDLYDAIRLNDTTLLFAVADVAGKGAPAGLTMARTLGLIRASAALLTARGGVPGPAEILGLANDDLARENEDATFVTVALGVLDMIAGTGRIAVAAHEAPLLFGAG